MLKNPAAICVIGGVLALLGTFLRGHFGRDVPSVFSGFLVGCLISCVLTVLPLKPVGGEPTMQRYRQLRGILSW